MPEQTLHLWDAVVPEYRRRTMAEIQRAPLSGLTAISSFSGCGGSSLGLRAAGWRVAAAIEFIPAAAETYRANFPTTHLIERDIRDVSPEELLGAAGVARGELDLWEGTPPCASFSAAGMRERGWGTVKKYSDSEQRTDDLFGEYERLLAGMMPRAFIAENVPGMMAGEALEAYGRATMRRLGGLGYRVGVKVLNCANFGVPQERRRLIFIGFRSDLGVSPEFPAPSVSEPFTTRQALESVRPDDPDHAEFLEESSMRGKAVGRTWEWLVEGRAKDVCARCELPLDGHARELREVGSVKKAKGAEEATRTKWVHLCADGAPATEIKDYFLLVVPELDRPCPTLTATGSQVGAASVVHPTECRKFTPAEAKAMSGFPRNFVLTGSREQRYERIGRAVPPPLYEVLGGVVARTLEDLG